MAEGSIYQEGCNVDYTPVVAVSAGEVIQFFDGRAAVCHDAIAASAKGAAQVRGIVKLDKTITTNLLAGGRAYWDASASKVHFKKVNDRDFYIGRVYADAAYTDTTCYVVLNIDPRYDIDFQRDSCISVPTGTKAAGAFGYPKQVGGGHMLELTATSEAQCIDLLTADRFSKDANPIAEFIVKIDVAGTDNTVDMNFGLANGTSTSDADAVTEYVYFHLDGGDLNINGQSKDGTTTVASTDSTLDFVAGTAVANRYELWIDARDTAAVKIYVDGLRILDGTTGTSRTIKIDGATGPLGLLAHIEKTSGTATGRFTVEAMRARLMEQ